MSIRVLQCLSTGFDVVFKKDLQEVESNEAATKEGEKQEQEQDLSVNDEQLQVKTIFLISNIGQHLAGTLVEILARICRGQSYYIFSMRVIKLLC